ncbi:MAG TPA: hypothetical protein VN765_16145 [Candidatus Acidoferrum sp.]|nr:hypothetical protein [Candidatus Acidoferrum sp.]
MIVLFHIDPGTGKLASSGQVLAAPSPVCVKFVPVTKAPRAKAQARRERLSITNNKFSMTNSQSLSEGSKHSSATPVRREKCFAAGTKKD